MNEDDNKFYILDIVNPESKIYFDVSSEDDLYLTDYYYETLMLCHFYKYNNLINIKFFILISNIIHEIIKSTLENKLEFSGAKDIIFKLSEQVNKTLKDKILHFEYFNDDSLNVTLHNIFRKNFDGFIKDFIEDIKPPCVAICYSKSNPRFSYYCRYALSGAKKDYIGSTIKEWVGKYNDRMAKAYEETRKLINCYFGCRPIECHLNDNVLRYTRLSSKPFTDFEHVYGFLMKKGPKSLIEDYKKHDLDILTPYYSCCERKILGSFSFRNYDFSKLDSNLNPINFLSDLCFLIKKEPCRMCRPALVGCFDIIIAFNNGFYKIANSSRKKIEPLILHQARHKVS